MPGRSTVEDSLTADLVAHKQSHGSSQQSTCHSHALNLIGLEATITDELNQIGPFGSEAVIWRWAGM
jgi:hypothetical protein